jgi:hypothetical protein
MAGSHGFCLLNNIAIGAAYALSTHRHAGLSPNNRFVLLLVCVCFPSETLKHMSNLEQRNSAAVDIMAGSLTGIVTLCPRDLAPFGFGSLLYYFL